MNKNKDSLIFQSSDKILLDTISKASSRLNNKLKNLDVKSLNISEYNKRYLLEKIKFGSLQLYSRLLYLCFNDVNLSPEKLVFVDYGGGIGLLSFLAKEMGIGTVIYNDIYDVSCNDVEKLSDHFELKLDHIHCGDIEDLVKYLKEYSLSINAISSYDVIEHIYNIQHHFQQLSSLGQDKFRIVHVFICQHTESSYCFFYKKETIGI